jgi:hypothetical protein
MDVAAFKPHFAQVLLWMNIYSEDLLSEACKRADTAKTEFARHCGSI